MRYHNITKDDMLNGDGLRTVLWVSGCSHGCIGCHNPITWNESEGLIFDEEAENELKEELSKDYISGLTLSGGDPLFAGNRNDLTELVKRLKSEFPDKTIWLYTGFTYEEIKSLHILDYIDVLVDGKFIEEQKDPLIHWRGSKNQRVIDMKKTKQNDKVVLHCE